MLMPWGQPGGGVGGVGGHWVQLELTDALHMYIYMLLDSLIRKAHGFLKKVLQEITSPSVILCLFIHNSLFIHNIT